MNVIAYLDPGTGTIIMQAVLGGAAGIAVLVKSRGRRFRKGADASAEGEELAAVEGDAVAEAEVAEPTST